MNRLLTTLKMVTLSALLMGMTVMAAGAAEEPKPILSNTDCVKCHSAAPAAIAANGSAHKTEIGCQDCHNGHPPTVKKIIPACIQCHSDKPHYKLVNCQRCHTNTHTPKIIKLPKDITAECLTCHTKQNEKLKQFKSKHSALSCSFCHSTHGKIPLCTQCHKSHSPDMLVSDCKRCHQAHMPNVVTYTSDTANNLCASCHKQASVLHAKTDTKHNKVSCVACHKDTHKMVPSCQTCHGAPHPARIMARFNKCSFCHNIAHDLNRWEPETPKKPGAAVKQAPKAVKK